MVRPSDLSSYRRLAYGARSFAVVVALVPGLAAGTLTELTGVAVLALLWVAVAGLESAPLRPWASIALESIAVASVSAASLGHRSALLVALMVPGFTAALRLGARGLAVAMSLEIVTFVPVAVIKTGLLSNDQATASLTWLLAGVGLGAIALFLHSNERRSDPLSPYLDAQDLIRDLIELSGTLDGSLDALAPAHRIAEQITDDLPVSHLQVAVSRDGALSPVVSIPEPLGIDLSDIARRAWTDESVVLTGDDFAFPLRTGSGQIGVVSGRIGNNTMPEEVLLGRVRNARDAVADYAVHLDTALLFATLREAATAQERRRLAREMHDGIAQDIASLGYLVDALSRHSSPEQTKALDLLRARISGVVAEVRQSVQSLRSDVNESPSLGAAISSVARHLSATSATPIRVSLDERTTRLRPEVEAQLMRIAQEAMNNAVRHAEASSIEVRVRVTPGTAQIVVRDDGTGMKQPRPDSHGLSIMRERAALIDADLEIIPVAPHGTAVIVRLRSSSRAGHRSVAARVRG
jgi:signal transduction histidine kinase